MSKIVTTIVLILLYIFGIGPLALFGKLMGKDFIGEKRRHVSTYWLRYEAKEATIENLRKQY